MTLSRPATVSALASGAFCNSHKMRGRKLKAEGLGWDNFFTEHTAMKSYPDEQTWTVDDINNQRRISDEIEKSIHRMHLRMLAAVLAVGALMAVAIHFLSTP